MKVTAWCDFGLGLDGMTFENEDAARRFVWAALVAQGATDPEYMTRLEEDGMLTFRKVNERTKSGDRRTRRR